MLAEIGNEENNLTYLTINAKRLDKISLYQFITSLQEKNYSVTYTCKNEFNFPTYLVNEIEINPSKKHANIVLNFYNFFQYSPALHDYLAENILHTQNKSFLIFLNIFYNRIFQLILESRKAQHTFFSMRNHIQMFASLAGFVDGKDSDFLEYHSYFTCKHRSKFNLEKMLRQYTNMMVLTEEFLGSFAPFNEEYQSRLNRSILNGYYSLGKKYWNEDSKIKIIFYPRSKKDWIFFKNKNKAKSLINLISKFINNTTDFEIVVFPRKINQTILKNKSKGAEKLGLNTYLCLHEKANRTCFFKFYSR